MTNLFSTFDPNSWGGAPLNWTSILFVLVMMPPMFWATLPQAPTLMKLTLLSVAKEFKAVALPNSNPGMLALPLSLFSLILINNTLGLVPYVFTAPSHLSITLSLALPLWIGHMVMASLKTPNSVLAHLVPLGTPPVLMPFMVLIEMISSVIRPLTLSVRLAANMIAGHLLLALMAGQAANLPYSLLLGLLSGLIMLGMLECAVSMIQAYVFSVLSVLYVNEVNSTHLS